MRRKTHKIENSRTANATERLEEKSREKHRGRETN
jgi:hypothetical protein